MCRTNEAKRVVPKNDGFKSVLGIENNVIRVQKSDFDAFEALDMDSAAVAKATAHKRLQFMPSANFGQESNKKYTMLFLMNL